MKVDLTVNGKEITADVEVAVVQPPLDALGVDLDADRDATVQRHGERLRATHPAEPGGQSDGARE